MTFLKNLGEKIGTAAGTAADKAKKLAEISRLNGAISTEEKHINQAYLEIGKLVFEQDKDNPESPAAEYCYKILAAQQTIEELKHKIAELKAADEKPAAAPAVAPAPEATQPHVETPSAPARKFCSNCGAENTANSKFCSGCGQPMN